MKFFARFVGLVFGLFLFALGIVITMKARIGFAPWDVFHAGLAKTTGLSIGTVTIIVGFLILVATVLLGERLGLGSVLNMMLIGVFVDLILASDLLPAMKSFPAGLLVMILGLFVVALGSFFYIRSGFGAGPRDSLMVALRRLSGLPIGLSRGIVEGMAVLAGWLLGGPAGAGTVIAALGVGFCVQITFSLLRFDPTAVDHETLAQTFSLFRSKSEPERAGGE